MRKIYLKSIVAAFALLVPSTVYAYDFESNGLYYNKLSSNTCEVTFKDSTFNSYSGMKVIPETVTNDNKTYEVVKIGNSAFRLSSGLTKVVIQSKITAIGDYSFTNCNKLTSITIPANVVSIGKRAFERCETLSLITLEEGLTTIGESAFSQCSSLKTITIPNSVKSMGTQCFYNCM